MRQKSVLSLLGSLFSAAALVLVSSAASASSANNTIYSLSIRGTQYAVIGVIGGPYTTSRPACHDTSGFYYAHWAFDVSTAKGKAQLAVAQAALLSGKTVIVNGGTTCVNVASSGTLNIEVATELQINAS